ncbi:dienelactone hydrolase family protein [Roseisolibacter sp. H3M3-2]|uniref:dienelactone hydrolase family protein n=1 Tax=Roseisolibacter sp. H3M3-2 TaxID=3031323 RepID=UPI0023DA2C6E|nr:dienelactone hydrolase family protein [Roseisolibacter sp. H3M3-2]MDF1505937.1 dienelactone hydrolase family protein [Roseisolibacter sp. H3M3-2]
MSATRRPSVVPAPAPLAALALGALALAGCARSSRMTDEHAGHAAETRTTTTSTSTSTTRTTVASSLPAGATDARARLERSPRHGEWAMVRTSAGDSVRAWVVYPERATKAPVVLVVHEIFGLSPWIRAVADQLAAEGFIAIAPDLLTGKGVGGTADSADAQAAVAAVRQLQASEVQARLLAVAQYGMGLPAATQKYGIVGFCWGGTAAFQHAAFSPTLSAAVPYYGGVNASFDLTKAKAAVFANYGENDARVNATIPAADSALKAAGVPWQYQTYAGAGHGFLRQQDGQNGANMTATQQAWPRTVAWFKQHLEAN